MELVINFHAITPGEAYRSAQLNKKQFEKYIKQYSLRSVLNLRGKNLNEKWYEDEIAICSSLGVTHYDVQLSAINKPTEEETREILEIFKSAPRPLLIHCRYGADRTGLVAAMWRVAVDGESKQEAEKQLTILYGHLPIGMTQEMNRYFAQWNYSK
ncbi:MAG: dual specificity protein phosphatase family protein [Elusimicrobiota bacterium]